MNLSSLFISCVTFSNYRHRQHRMHAHTVLYLIELMRVRVVLLWICGSSSHRLSRLVDSWIGRSCEWMPSPEGVDTCHHTFVAIVAVINRTPGSLAGGYNAYHNHLGPAELHFTDPDYLSYRCRRSPEHQVPYWIRP